MASEILKELRGPLLLLLLGLFQGSHVVYALVTGYYFALDAGNEGGWFSAAEQPVPYVIAMVLYSSFACFFLLFGFLGLRRVFSRRKER